MSRCECSWCESEGQVCEAPPPSRAAVLAYLRALPAGGIEALVAEAKVAEWEDIGHEAPNTHYLRAAGGEAEGLYGRDDRDGHWEACWGPLDPTWHPDEPAARAWVEARAVEDGWTIARAAKEEG